MYEVTHPVRLQRFALPIYRRCVGFAQRLTRH
jgi:hypothetical protein